MSPLQSEINKIERNFTESKNETKNIFIVDVHRNFVFFFWKIANLIILYDLRFPKDKNSYFMCVSDDVAKVLELDYHAQ